MSEKQTINCSVCDCAYNDEENKECSLKSITIEPSTEEKAELPEDSLCGSFECKDDKEDNKDDEESNLSE